MDITITLTDDQAALLEEVEVDIYGVLVNALSETIVRAKATAISSQIQQETSAAVTEINSMFRLWAPGIEVAVGDTMMHRGHAWTVVQAHTTQADWEPQDTPALWRDARLPADDGAPAEWQAPTGAHDAYQTGDRVTFEGAVYESLIDGNVHSPTAYPAGWQRLD